MQTIIHITDLHHSVPGTALGEASKAFVSLAATQLRDMKQRGELGWNPILLFTGDIVQMGGGADDTEYKGFHDRVLKPLVQALDIKIQDVVIVPGNHEIDTRASHAEQFLTPEQNPKPTDIHEDLRRKLSGFFHFVQKTGIKSVTRDDPRRVDIEINNTHFNILNGLVGIYSVKTDFHEDMGSGFFIPSELANMLTDIPPKSVVCMHHPLNWYTPKTRLALKAAFANAKCRLITGHEHSYGISEIDEGSRKFIHIQGPAAGTAQMNVGMNIIHLSPSDFAVGVRRVQYEVGQSHLKTTEIPDTQIFPTTATKYLTTNTRILFDVARTADVSRKLAAEILDIFNQHMSCKVEIS